jgi:hypothetical protein
MQLEHSAQAEGHTLRVVVTKHPAGWRVCHEVDSVPVRILVSDDWHRVERELRLFLHRTDMTAGEPQPAIAPRAA